MRIIRRFTKQLGDGTLDVFYSVNDIAKLNTVIISVDQEQKEQSIELFNIAIRWEDSDTINSALDKASSNALDFLESNFNIKSLDDLKEL